MLYRFKLLFVLYRAEPLPLNAIIEAVCSKFDINKELVVSQGKSHKISFARAMVGVIAVNTSQLSIVQIAAHMNRNHSTLSALILRFNDKYQHSKEVQLYIKTVTEEALKIAICNV